MQDIILESLWYSSELSHKVHELSRTMRGYREAAQAYETIAKQVEDILGFELYDQYLSAQTRFSNYEVYAWYALGLGLCKELVQMFEF